MFGRCTKKKHETPVKKIDKNVKKLLKFMAIKRYNKNDKRKVSNWFNKNDRQ